MNETIITKNNKPGNIGMTAKNRGVLVGYLRKVKMDIEKFKTNNDNFAYLSIKLDCGCEVEYHKEKDLTALVIVLVVIPLLSIQGGL